MLLTLPSSFDSPSVETEFGYDNTTRAMVVGMKVANVPTAEIAQSTELQCKTIGSIYKKALQRGFDPTQRPVVLKEAFLVDGSRSGRPKKDHAAKRAELTTAGKRDEEAMAAEVEVSMHGTKGKQDDRTCYP